VSSTALAAALALATEGDPLIRSEPFAFGIEYMVPGLARLYAATGATWAKPAPAGFDWGSIEQHPPVNGKHAYNWTFPDALIREYQEAGFRHFHIYTQARSPWASSKPLPPIGHPAFMPKPQYLDDYAEYLRNLVERYDGDGVDDMPGLRFPIRYWEIEAEWGTFWQSSVADYLQLLRLAHKTVKAADPQAKIILQGFLLMGIFDGDPNLEKLEEKKADPTYGAKVRQALADLELVMKHQDLFDAVEFHSLGDWSEIIGTTRHLRAAMRRYGYEKPIWAGDINFTLNPMLWWGKAYYPYAAYQKPVIEGWIRAMKNASHPRHAEALRWFRAEQAAFVAKKLVCCFGEGLAGANMGNLEDWPFLAILPNISGTGGFCGLTDIVGLGLPAKGLPKIAGPRIAGQPRPAYWTLKLLIEKLSPYMATTRLDLGKGIYAYRCHSPNREGRQPSAIVILWLDDGKGRLPGEPRPQKRVSLPTTATAARLQRIVTEIGQQTPPPPAPVPVHNRSVTLAIDDVPVILEETP